METDHESGIASYTYVRHAMAGGDFIRQVERLGHKHGIHVRFEARKGKGGHGRIYYGDRFTTVKDRRKEIGKGLLTAMLTQLGLSYKDL